MTNPHAAFIHSAELDQYHYPDTCPFKTERAARTKAILASMDFYTGVDRIEVAPIAATDEELHLFHTDEYLASLRRVSGGDFRQEDLFIGLGTDDTPIFNDLYPYAVLAAGGSLTGVTLLLNGSAEIVFNPSGGYHHACAGKAGGFCYINDVALACFKLANAGKRVLCLDFDAHHGNGTQEAFYSTDQVFTVSFHESGTTLYPWAGFEHEIGEGAGKGYNLNMPFPAGTDDDAYFAAYQELVPSIIAAYNPDVIVCEVGMDILSVDPLTHLSMTNNCIADIISKIVAYNKPILAVGGGGYSAEDTARGWALCWTALCRIMQEEDLYIGLGGVFLGSAEWNAGLRDPHIYQHGNNREQILQTIHTSIETLKKTIFPIHKI